MYENMLNTEEVACDFSDWLARNGYLTFEEEITCLDAMIDDFAKAYEVAPKLIQILANIAK